MALRAGSCSKSRMVWRCGWRCCTSCRRRDDAKIAKNAKIAKKKMPYEDEIPPYATLAQPSEEINQLAHRVLGICIEIHRELGPGLPEEAYEEALAMEFEAHGIRFQRRCGFRSCTKVDASRGYGWTF